MGPMPKEKVTTIPCKKEWIRQRMKKSLAKKYSNTNHQIMPQKPHTTTPTTDKIPKILYKLDSSDTKSWINQPSRRNRKLGY